VGAVGFRREDGTWIGVLINHAMHPVALGPNNRRVSADVPGQVAGAVSRALPGNPVVLVTNGACGNLNPPLLNVAFSQVEAWGAEIAAAISGPLRRAQSERLPRLQVRHRRVSLPVDALDGEKLDDYIKRSLETPWFVAAWGEGFRRAVEQWKETVREAGVVGGKAASRVVELMVVALGTVIFVGVNAEIFSRFTSQVRHGSRRPVYVVGYANGVLGYLPTAAAFTEGGYEVDAAHFFYGGFRFQAGALERLAEEAAALVAEVASHQQEDVA
jgi:hypothetical protein